MMFLRLRRDYLLSLTCNFLLDVGIRKYVVYLSLVISIANLPWSNLYPGGLLQQVDFRWYVALM